MGAVGSSTIQGAAERIARNRQLGYSGTIANWGQTGGTARIDWQTHRADAWQELADTVAAAACGARGYRLARATFGPGHDDRKGNLGGRPGDNLGWFYTENRWTELGGPPGAGHSYQAWQSRTWTATCKKVIRRARR